MSEQTGWETKLSTIGLPIILSLYDQLCWRICRKHLFAHVHAPGGNKTSWQAAGVEGERYVSTSSKHRKSLIGEVFWPTIKTILNINHQEEKETSFLSGSSATSTCTCALPDKKPYVFPVSAYRPRCRICLHAPCSFWSQPLFQRCIEEDQPQITRRFRPLPGTDAARRVLRGARDVAIWRLNCHNGGVMAFFTSGLEKHLTISRISHNFIYFLMNSLNSYLQQCIAKEIVNACSHLLLQWNYFDPPPARQRLQSRH